MSLKEILSEDEYSALEKIAYQKSKPFCYSCYKEVESKYCADCGSDDSMRLIRGYGAEYGIEWVFEHLIAENCAPVDPDFAEDSLRECYGDTVKVGWIEVDPIEAIKELDPISYRIAIDEYVDGFRNDGEIVEVGSEDYWKDDILKFIEDNELEEEVA